MALMKKITLFLIGVVLGGITAAPQAATTPGSSFFFIQLADPQFGMFTGDRDFVQETANYEFAVAAVNRLKPQFVIICGDLINKPGDEALMNEYDRITRKLDPSIHVYHLPGNHDVGNKPTAESNAKYRKRFGPDYYSFREGNVYGIVLNSSLIYSPEDALQDYERQYAWLKSELIKASESNAEHIIVFQHHPFFLNRGDEVDDYFNIPLVRRKPLLELFHKYRVKYLLSGHYHRNAHGWDGDIEMVTTGAVGKPLGGSMSGIRVVWVDGSRLTHEFFDFGRIPPQAVPSKTKTP